MPAAKAGGGSKAADSGPLALAASLERKVVNCLGCGKIYDCRNAMSNDVLRFLGGWHASWGRRVMRGEVQWSRRAPERSEGPKQARIFGWRLTQ